MPISSFGQKYLWKRLDSGESCNMAIIKYKWMPDINWSDGPVRHSRKKGVRVRMAALHGLQIGQQHVNTVLATAPRLLERIYRVSTWVLSSDGGLLDRRPSLPTTSRSQHCIGWEVPWAKEVCRSEVWLHSKQTLMLLSLPLPLTLPELFILDLLHVREGLPAIITPWCPCQAFHLTLAGLGMLDQQHADCR